MISDSIGDFILALRDPDLFVEKALLTADKVQDAVSRGLRLIITLVKWALISLGASLLLAVLIAVCLSTGWSPSWLNLILLILFMLGVLAGLALLAPLVMLSQPVVEAVPGFKKWLTRYPAAIASAAFLMSFAVFSYWKLQSAFSPAAAAKIFFVMLFIAAGSATGWVALPRSSLKAIITSQLFLCLFFLTAYATLPKILPATTRWLRHRELQTSNRLDEDISQLVKIDPDDPPRMWFDGDGSPMFSYTQDRGGVFRVFHADVKFDPATGQSTSLVTTVEKRDEIIAQARSARDMEISLNNAQAAQRQREAQREADRKFREKYLDDAVLSAGNRKNPLLVVIKAEPRGGSLDIVAQVLSARLVEANQTPVLGALKPAFVDDGLFDALWNGDQSIIDRLRLLEPPSSTLLLGRASFSGPSKTDFDGIVSVQGTLSVMLIDKQGRRGPWVFKASGAGDKPTASANCAKRLVEAIDMQVVFP